MDCKEAERLIPVFLSGEATEEETKVFLDHVDSCAECREELTIQFLISTGIQRLEEGGAFDLRGELNDKISQARRSLRRHRKLLFTARILQLLVLGETAAVIAIAVLNLGR